MYKALSWVEDASDFAYFASEFLYDFFSLRWVNFDGVEGLWCSYLEFNSSL